MDTGSFTSASVQNNGNSWFGHAADFVLHTLIVYYCALRLSQWLVFHWFGWIAPILGAPISIPATDWYLQHFELTTIFPAVVLGYVNVSRLFPATVRRYLDEGLSGSMEPWAWSVPSVVLLSRMLVYHLSSSVLFGTPVTAISYFFDIQKVMPTFSNPLASDPVRVWAQMSITSPFYTGVAYSSGALASKYELLTKLFAFERRSETTTSEP